MENRTIDRARLTQILRAIRDARVAFAGDVCVDAYWYADMRRSALSRETPHFNLPVISERYSLGAGGNVVANMAALRPAAIYPVTVLGRDWRGVIARDLMEKLGCVDFAGVVTDETRVTPAYCKPHKIGYAGVPVEEPRIDFENASALPDATANELAARFRAVAGKVSGVAVGDQFACGVVTEPLRGAICAGTANGPVTVVDSRDRVKLYRNVVLKPNEIEAAAALGQAVDAVTLERFEPIARELAARSGAGAVVTLGSQGALCAVPDGAIVHVPACLLEPPFDIVGAGDTFLSALVTCMAAGATMAEAAAVGALASGVTVKKLGQTGTATPEEIVDLFDQMEAKK